MKARIILSGGMPTAWVEYDGDPLTALMSTPDFPENEPRPKIETAFSTMDEVRKERSRLIQETDWTQTADAPLSADKVEEFKAYRQLLRDIPQNYDDPDSVVWPEKPAT